jgi:photosystem II stability/assembly factor-like uncharacterized protein
LCVAAGPEIYTATDPTGGASAWTGRALPDPSSYANRVSCPTTTLCVANEDDGKVASSTDPTGGETAWAVRDIDGNRPLNGIFCSTRPQCLVSDISGTVLTSEDPAGNASTWSVSKTTPTFFDGTCPTPSLCVTLNGHKINATIDPTAGTWTTTTVGDALNGIACPASSLCVAVGDGGALYTSIDPAVGDWSHATVDNGRLLYTVSCASPSLCVATDSSGHVVTSTNPTGGPSAWSPALIDGDPCNDTTPCSSEQVDASDALGLRTVDSSNISGDGHYLTGLTLSGDVLSWSHDGSPRSVSLARP